MNTALYEYNREFGRNQYNAANTTLKYREEILLLLR